MIVYDSSDSDVEGSITQPQCFQYMGKDGTKFGVVEVCIDSAMGVLVDGRELLEDELKVKVIERYELQVNGENLDFLHGNILALKKIQLKKMQQQQKRSKKLGTGNTTGKSPNKWKREESKRAKKSGGKYVSYNGKIVQAKMLGEPPCEKCKFTVC